MLGVGIIGVGRRFRHVYAPLVETLPDLRLVAVSGRDSQRAAEVAGEHAVAALSVEALLEREDVGLVIACVEWRANAGVYGAIACSDKPALVETPLGATLAEAESTARALEGRKVATTVAEQYPHRPVEALKRQLIEAGVFGPVFHAFNDGVGHEYHGASLIRSFLGRGRRLLRASAIEREVPIAPHRLHRNVFLNGERHQHALLEFEGNCTATHHWSWLNYESPIRARRAAGFHGVLGAGWGEECVTFGSMEDEPVSLRLQRRTRVVEGVEVLHELVALRGAEALLTWHNPFPGLPLHEELLAVATLLGSAIETAADPHAKSIYPPHEALADQRVAAAISTAASRGHTVVLEGGTEAVGGL